MQGAVFKGCFRRLLSRKMDGKAQVQLRGHLSLFCYAYFMSFLDNATLISLIALNIDILLQNKRVWGRKSSKDISLSGLLVRYIAIFILLAKYFSLQDWVLIVGQAIIAVNVTIYLVLVVRFRSAKG